MRADEAFYEVAADGSFVATAWTRGPWHRDLQHGGPPAALLLRAMERALGEGEHQLARLTTELMRPVPIAALHVALAREREGRRAVSLTATLLHAGKPVARAHGLFVRRVPLPVPPELAPPAPADPRALPEHAFEFFADPVGYNGAIEVRREPGPFPPGSGAAWLRMRGRLVAGEAPSPAVRVVVAADAINGVGFGLAFDRWSFINADLTVHLHRLPEGEYVRLASVHTSQPTGVGLVDAALADVRGPIGRALETQVLELRAPPQP